MTDSQSVHWQPISELPTVARSVNELLENSEEQYESLAEARSKPHVLDDEIIERVVRLYTERLQYLRTYRQQLDRWKQSQPTAQQMAEIRDLNQKVTRGKKLSQQILALAQELRKGTIDRIMAMDDVELAMKVLSGELALPGRRNDDAR